MTTNPKPLAVGDRVRKREILVVTELDVKYEGCTGMVFVDAAPESQWMPGRWLHEGALERIDPAPPVDPGTGLFDEVREAIDDIIRTLTAERDAARAELAEERARHANLLEGLKNLAETPPPYPDWLVPRPAEQRYPLWCHDSGEIGSESRYTIYTDGDDAAFAARGGKILSRCRKVNAFSSHIKDYPDKTFIKLPEWDFYICEGDEP